MATKRTHTDSQILAFLKKYGSERKAAAKLKVAKSTFHDWVVAARTGTFTTQQMSKPVKISNPRKGEIKYFILTSAQDGTKVHEKFVDNLETYALHLGAQIMVAGFTYSKALFADHGSANAKYHQRIAAYVTNDSFDIGTSLRFSAELNILPTAVNPLSGLDTYTKERDGIFPHAKVALKSIPTMKNSNAKIISTTGTVTQPNYVQKKAGQKAEFHHVYGAIIVELLPDGTYFQRHLLGEEKSGAFYDLDRKVSDGKVTSGHRVEALTHGDIHYEKLDYDCALASFGFETIVKKCVTRSNLLDYLQPKMQFIHDISDFTPRNHHNRGSHTFIFKTHINGEGNVASALDACSNFLKEIERDFCKTIVVESNHDQAFEKWLDEADYRTDPVNAIFFLACQYARYRAIENGTDGHFNIFEDALRSASDCGLTRTEFLRIDDSYMTCGNIENAMHGHVGANGARGSILSYARSGSRSIVGHSHSPAIFEGCYMMGVVGGLDMGYNKGLSSWSHTSCITYPNGKRTLITMNANGEFHA